MTYRALWNIISDELFLSDVFFEIGFVYSTKESENKNAECISCNGKFSEDDQREIWIKYFNWTLPEQKTQSISMTFINRLEAEMIFA